MLVAECDSISTNAPSISENENEEEREDEF